MNSLTMKVSELKKNLMDINKKAIKKCKERPIKIDFKNDEEKYLFDCYNYHLKLTRRLKKYISTNKNKELILKMLEDNNNKAICIAIDIEQIKRDIGIEIVINIITGNECGAFLNCTYFDTNMGGKLYLNDFRSLVPNKGYGSIILKNIDNIINYINEVLYTMGYDDITLLEGVMIANTNIISGPDLSKLYLKYRFSIDDENKIKRYFENDQKIKSII